MLEHGQKVFDFIPFFGAIIRGDKRRTPIITRWMEGLMLPAGGVLLALYISDGKHSSDIDNLKERTSRIEEFQQNRTLELASIRQEESQIRRDLGQRLDSIQNMLAIQLSKKK